MNNKYLKFTLLAGLALGNFQSPLYAADDHQSPIPVQKPFRTIKLDKDTQELIATKVFPATVVLALTSLALSRYFHSKTIKNYEELLHNHQRVQTKYNDSELLNNNLITDLKSNKRDIISLIKETISQVQESSENLITFFDNESIPFYIEKRDTLKNILKEINEITYPSDISTGQINKDVKYYLDIYENEKYSVKRLNDLLKSIATQLMQYPRTVSEAYSNYPSQRTNNLDTVQKDLNKFIDITQEQAILLLSLNSLLSNMSTQQIKSIQALK